MRDLLGVPWAQVANRLPEDGEAYRFNKSGEALDVSYVRMARFMDSANYAMRQAMATGLERPAKKTRKLYARDEPSLRNWWPHKESTACPTACRSPSSPCRWRLLTRRIALMPPCDPDQACCAAALNQAAANAAG